MKALVHWGAPLAAAAALFFSSGCVPAATSFSVGGNIAGLAGALSLSLNGVETLPITSNGSYTFATKLASFVPFAVLLPVTWLAWTGRLAVDRIAHGPTKRETEFVPYAGPTTPDVREDVREGVRVRDLRIVA